MNTLKEANENEISFLHNPRYLNDLKNTKAKAVLVDKQHLASVPKSTYALLCPNPYLQMALLSKHFYEHKYTPAIEKNAISSSAQIDERASIGKGVKIGVNTKIYAGAFVGDFVSIGDNCIIYPNVVIYDFCSLGDETIIHANTTIGSDGFGYAVSDDNLPVKIYHCGNVQIGNCVEIGANTSIDKAVFGSTRIDDYCKFDNQIQVGHNCTFGAKTAVVASCAFGGSTHVGKEVLIMGQSGFVGHISIADKTLINARTMVTKDITKSGSYSGQPAIEHKEWLKKIAKENRLIKKN